MKKILMVFTALSLLSLTSHSAETETNEKLCDENISGHYVVKYWDSFKYSYFAHAKVEKGIEDKANRTCTYKVTNQIIQDEIDWLMGDYLSQGEHASLSEGYAGIVQGVQYIQLKNVKTGLDSIGNQPYAVGDLAILDKDGKAMGLFEGYTVSTRPELWGTNANPNNDAIIIFLPETKGTCGTLEGGGSVCPSPGTIRYIRAQ